MLESDEETDTTVDCGYDSQGRRYFKKVTVAGTVTLHHRYIYRGYLQIACVDCTRSGHPALWFVTWDPSQATATRPLAIQKDGTWFTYGYDLTKNICEVFGQHGYIRTAYSYAPFGNVTASGDVSQPFQWSSEHYDSELDLVYYNYRHYSPSLGRFLSRDPIAEQGGLNLYAFVKNNPVIRWDFRGGTSNNNCKPCLSPYDQCLRESEEKHKECLRKVEEEIAHKLMLNQLTFDETSRRIEEMTNSCKEKCNEQFPLPEEDASRTSCVFLCGVLFGEAMLGVYSIYLLEHSSILIDRGLQTQACDNEHFARKLRCAVESWF